MIGDVPGAEPPSAAHQLLPWGHEFIVRAEKSETERLSPGSATEYLLADDDVLFECGDTDSYLASVT